MSYPEDIINYAWERANVVDGFDPMLFRKDACGAWIRRDFFGSSNNPMGWGIDLIFPASRGGTPIRLNVRALNWGNLESKASDYPSYMAEITSEGTQNVRKDMYLVINGKLRSKLKTIYKDA